MLVKFGWISNDLLDYLVRELTTTFKPLISDVKIKQEMLRVPSIAYDDERDQYIANDFIEELVKLAKKKKYYRALGITRADIFTKNFNFIFGMAESVLTPGPKVAIISTCRLSNEFWNIPSDKESDLQRTLKEAVHEIGHTFGLDHCYNSCIMRFSNSLNDTDEKPATFCDQCQKKLDNIS